MHLSQTADERDRMEAVSRNQEESSYVLTLSYGNSRVNGNSIQFGSTFCLIATGQLSGQQIATAVSVHVIPPTSTYTSFRRLR